MLSISTRGTTARALARNRTWDAALRDLRHFPSHGGAVQVQVDPGYPVVFAVDPTLAFRHFQGLSGAFRGFQGLSALETKT